VHFFLEDDGHLASHAAVLRHVVSVNGQDATIAGLGGVVTLPWAQRRGYARALVTHAMDCVKDANVDGGLLFCITKRVPYYAAMGWELVDGPVFVEQPKGRIVSPLPVMTLPWTSRLRARSISRIDLDSLPW
jgi:predicted acetyltransferase